MSNYGRIKSLKRSGLDRRMLNEIILKPGRFSNDYLFVCLRKDGSNKNHLIHRLVAESFIPNPNNYPIVNHKDGDKTNNHVSNLEWCTQSYNLKHAIEIGTIENQCKIRRSVTIVKNNTIIVFQTMKGCAKFFGFKKSWLHNRIRKYGNKFTYQGWSINVNERGDAENGNIAIL